MTRAKARGYRVGVDFRCRDHDKRMGLLWIDIREPDELLTRLPGGESLPEDWNVAHLACPVCDLGVIVQSGPTLELLASRHRTLGFASTLSIPVWRGDIGQPAGTMFAVVAQSLARRPVQRSNGPICPRKFITSTSAEPS